MAQSIVRGNPITLDGFFWTGEGDAIDPPDPRISIIDANGVTVVNLVVPTHIATGHYQYVYAVSPQALLGAWAIRWFGTVEGFALTDEDGFTVISAGATTPPGSGHGATCTPWATHEDAPAALQEYGIDPNDVDDAFQAATDILFQLTGRTYPGICTDVIRPQAQWWRSAGALPRWWPAGALPGSSWYGWCSCHRGRETGCNRVSEIRLPGHPVVADTVSVLIDGEAFDGFVVHDNRFLVRTDGAGWPCCQDLTLPDSEPSTFSIAYSYGSLPDIGGIKAAILLGTALYADYNPDAAARCKPPARTTRITRSGVTVDLLTPEDMIKLGLTGIRAVDQWIASKRYGRINRRTAVMVPGRGRSARRIPD